MPSGEKLVLVSALVNYIPYGYMNVVPLVYLLQVGYSPATIGTIYAASSIAVTVGGIPAGLLADKYGMKRFLMAGSALPAISYAIFGLTLNPYLLVLAGAIGGIGYGGGLASAMANVSTLPMLTKMAPAARRTTLTALLEADWVAAQSVGSVLSYLPSLLQSTFAQSSYSAHSESYLLMAALSGVSTIPLLFLREAKRTPTRDPLIGTHMGEDKSARTGGEEETNDDDNNKQKKPSRFVTLKFSLIFGLSGLGVGALVQLLPTWYSLRFGASEGTVGTWMALAQLASLVAIPLIPLLARWKGTLRTCVVTGVVALFFLVVMPLFGSFQIVALLFIVRSIVWAISWTLLQSFVLGVTPESKRSTTYGIVFAAWGIAGSVGNFIGAEFLNTGQLYLPFATGWLAYLGYSVALVVFFRRTKPPEEVSRVRVPK